MVKIKSPFPKEGDFVVGRAVNIEQQYIYVDLPDYDGLPSEDHARGMIHVSEVSSRWIKNIRNYVRIGQIIVCRVLRVDQSKGHVDLSLRRVNSAQKKKVLKERKYAVKFENLLQFLIETEGIKMSLDEVYEQIGWPILELFDYYQEAIEALKESGDEVFKNIPSIPKNVKDTFLNIVDENVEITTVKISGKVKLTYTEGDGIEKVKETFTNIKNIIENPRDTRKLEISYIGAPFYKIEITSKDYLDAESILSEAVEILESKTSKYNGSFELIRN